MAVVTFVVSHIDDINRLETDNLGLFYCLLCFLVLLLPLTLLLFILGTSHETRQKRESHRELGGICSCRCCYYHYFCF